ncbi:UNVERIFIED_CONTAM: hypothetical protein GTU68_039806 [Idotea baltica]|nr:hypothetical protein [Idotea baltica]
MKSGIILIDKEIGITSSKAILKLKRKLKLNKIGHTGTLDPFATGLLICPVNSATRLSDYALNADKTYSGIIKFGISTDTHDLEGKIVSESDNYPSLEEVKLEIKNFLGEISQIPPMASAIKVNGIPAYKKFRKGEEVILEPRKVRINKFEVQQLSANEFKFLIDVSKGTYIRSIARDLGKILDCGAILTELRRESSYPFNVKDAKKIDDLTEEDILTWTDLFPNIKTEFFDDEKVKKLQNGNQEFLENLSLDEGSERIVYSSIKSNNPLGLLIKKDDKWTIGFNLSAGV